MRIKKSVQHLLTQLNRPYPYVICAKNIIKNALIIGLFVFLFLCLFEPFGKDAIDNPYWKFVANLGYGLIAFFVLLINYFLLPKMFPKIFNEENWQVKHEILMLSWLLFTIGIGNFFYNHLVQQTDISITAFWKFQGYTFLLGSIITAFFFLFEQNWLLRQYLNSARKMNQQLQAAQPAGEPSEDLLVLTSENEKEQINIKQSNLLFIRSADNYVEIFKQQNSEIDVILLRSSLKRIEELLKSQPDIHRCHRAYLVNLKQIHQVIGNAQGYQLQFRNTPLAVPVSRNYAKQIRQRILQT